MIPGFDACKTISTSQLDGDTTTYRIDHIHSRFPLSSTLRRARSIHRACNLFNRDLHKVLACLATDPDLIFLERDEQDVDVEGWKADRRVDVQLCYSCGETCFLLLREGGRVSVDAPKRHVDGWRDVRLVLREKPLRFRLLA